MWRATSRFKSTVCTEQKDERPLSIRKRNSEFSCLPRSQQLGKVNEGLGLRRKVELKHALQSHTVQLRAHTSTHTRAIWQGYSFSRLSMTGKPDLQNNQQKGGVFLYVNMFCSHATSYPHPSRTVWYLWEDDLTLAVGFDPIYTSHSHLCINLLISDLTGGSSQSDRKRCLLNTGP